MPEFFLWRLLGVAFILQLAISSGDLLADTAPFADSREETYKSVDGTDLKLWIFEPDDHERSQRRPAIVFFFGGGWKGGDPGQFEHQCRYLASRGMVAMTADYRVRSRHDVLADRCVADAKSAIRWVRANSERLGIDPNRIIAGGGSAGGHLAACTAVIPDLDEPDEDPSISSAPDAVVLFNPALVLAPFEGVSISPEKIKDLAERTGVDPTQISPIHHIRSDLPPMIAFHGQADTTVAFATVKAFCDQANAAGSRFVLKGYDDQTHGFFNYGRGGTPGEYYLRTVAEMDRFLTSLGYLEGEPTIRLPESDNVHLRNGLQNSRLAIEKRRRATIAFMGGSITEMNGYRPLVMHHLHKRFPETEFKMINAGIASTCSTTGAFRLDGDVLSHNPDLLLVEFAVNDDQDAGHAARECLRGMEGIIRGVRKRSPLTDIVMLDFVNPPMLKLIQEGEIPLSVREHERVAWHYGISSVNIAKEVADRIASGTLTWKEYGGTHPKTPGNQLAADLVADLLKSAWSDPLPTDLKTSSHRAPKPLDSNSYDLGKLVDVQSANSSGSWEIKTPDWTNLPGNVRERFEDAKLLCGTDDDGEITLDFQGPAIGLYVLAGPDAGQIDASIDDGPFQSFDLYHAFSRGLHYPRTIMLAADLPRKRHQLRMRVSKQANSDSVGHSARILYFVVN